jgi:hypothetical protein
MAALLCVIGLLTASVIMLTWRLYRLEKAHYNLARIKLLEYYKTVPIFKGLEHDE